MPGPYLSSVATNDLKMPWVYVVDASIARGEDDGGGAIEFTVTFGSSARFVSNADAPAINTAIGKGIADALAAYDWSSLSIGPGWALASATVTQITENDEVIYTTP